MMSISYDKSAAHRFLKTLRLTIESHLMLRRGDAVLVGVSGGPDSMALLHALIAVSDVYRLRLGIAHLNHGLRQTDSDRDAEFVAAAAEKLNLPCYMGKKDIAAERKKSGCSIEETGRRARYRFFFKTAEAEGFQRIAVGHHRDDNAELILLYLLRGSGPAGISGIPPVRGRVIRPLIRTSRAEIMAFLDANKIDYVIDQSNTDQKFLRNRIRHHLLPLLGKEYNPRVMEALNRLGMILQADEDWFAGYIGPLLDKMTVSAKKEWIALSLEGLKSLHPAVKRRLIRKAIHRVKGDLRRITLEHVESVMGLMQTVTADARPEASIDLPDRIRVHKQADRLLISREKESLRSPALSGKIQSPPLFNYTLLKSDIPAAAGDAEKQIDIRDTGIRIRFNRIHRDQMDDLHKTAADTAYLDWDCLIFPLTVRNFLPGDRFTPLGMTGSQKLKKFFINNKISRLKRVSAPILSDRDGIVWIGGYRISDRVKVTDGTRTVLKARLFTVKNKKVF